MKIERLDLIKYGPFTDKILSFEKGNEGLHIVFGPNEAGKSSALRGLRDALYGIPTRTPAGFLHKMSDLRIGFTLVAKDGQRFEALRHKRSANTLTTPDTEKPLAESALSRLLAEVPRETFESMFGLDYEALVEGGRQIVALEGRVGESLFAAASGISKLRELLRKLESDATDIFSPRGQTKKLNAQLAEYRDCVKKGKERASSARYGELKKKRDELSATIAQLESTLREKRAEAAHLERLRAALTPLGQRRHYLTQLAGHTTTRVLRTDFATDLKRIQRELLRAETEWENERKKWEKAKQRREELHASDWPADVRTAIRELSRKLGAYQSAQRDAVELRAKQTVARDSAQHILARLRPDVTIGQAPQLRLRLADQEAIERLATQHDKLEQRRNGCVEQLTEIKSRQTEIDQQWNSLSSPVDVTSMQTGIDEIRELGAIEKQIDDKQRELTQDLQRLDSELRALGRWTKQSDELAAVVLPGLATVERFDDQLRNKQREIQDVKKRLKEIETLLAKDRQAWSSSRQQVGDLPTENDVKNSRSHRDEIWNLLRVAFLSGELNESDVQRILDQATARDATLEAKPSIANAFEQSVVRADQVVDRVRREEERIAEQVRLQQAVEDGERRVQELRDELAVATTELDALQISWHETWKADEIEVGTPPEMREWLHAVQALRKTRLDLQNRELELNELKRNYDTARQRLNEPLLAAGQLALADTESLRNAVRRAQKWVEQQSQLATDRRDLERDRRKIVDAQQRQQQQLDEVERDLKRWRDDWAHALEPLQLPATTHPEYARSFLKELQELFTHLDRVDGPDGYSHRLDQIAESERTFRAEVANLVAKCAMKASESLEETTAVLGKTLTDVEAVEREITQLDKDLPKVAERTNQLQLTVDGLRVELKRLCNEAGCETAEALDTAWAASEDRRKWQNQFEESEKVLIGLASGKSIDELEREAASIDASQLEAQLKAAQEVIDLLDTEIKPQRGELGRLNGELAQIESDDRGLATSTELQLRLAKIEQDALEYARIQLASAVLRRAIEQFAQRNQGPMLQRGSQLFNQLTCGSFAGLKIDYDGEEPILVGQRSGSGDRIRVDAMSEGTADQLYFAMRLAHLAEWLEHHEPLPVVVDDILIKFDDERSKATLQVLAEFSHKTQVILFTHHGHLIDLAREAVRKEQLFVHSL